MKTISVKELHSQAGAGEQIRLYDVRSPVEFRASHIDGSINLPLDRINQDTAAELAADGNPVYVICQSGTRSAQGAELLVRHGVEHVVCVTGGLGDWKKESFPVVEEGRAFTVDRQMRIVAGTLIVLGVVLSNVISPNFIYLSAFVGAGLIFAGVTDKCPMISVLSRMPWNQ